jgi:hypothetical protein
LISYSARPALMRNKTADMGCVKFPLICLIYSARSKWISQLSKSKAARPVVKPGIRESVIGHRWWGKYQMTTLGLSLFIQPCRSSLEPVKWVCEFV